MPPIRVLIVALPGILRDIIRGLLADEDDVEVVGDLRETEAVLAFMNRVPTDVVVMGCANSELPESGRRLFDEHPAVRVLCLSADGRRTFLFELRPHRVAIGEVSPDELVATIIGAVRPEGT